MQADSTDVKKTFDWTQQSKELLRKLQVQLSKTIAEWKRFSSKDGDIGYFQDIKPPTAPSKDPSKYRAGLALGTVKEMFEAMEELYQTLRHLQDDFKDSAKAVGRPAFLDLRFISLT
jgi:hypothetical protein